MTQEEKRIKLAEAAGMTGWEEARALPDYFNDLNAVHELEKVLGSKGRWELYEIEVVKLTGGWGQAIHATAAQRAEALGKNLKLW